MASKSSVAAWIVCVALGGGCRAEVDAKSAGGCDGDSGSGVVVHSNPDYQFSERNFTGEVDPIELPFDVDSASFSVAGLAAGDVIDDFEEARVAWSSTGADLELRAGNMYVSPGEFNSNDDGHGLESQIIMVPGPNPDGVGDLAAIAVTTQWGPIGLPPATSNCDVRFFSQESAGVDFVFVAGGAPSAAEIDVAYIMAHELGHCLGLGDGTAASTAADIMFGAYTAGTNFAVLSPGDEEAARALYCTG